MGEGRVGREGVFVGTVVSWVLAQVGEELSRVRTYRIDGSWLARNGQRAPRRPERAERTMAHLRLAQQPLEP